MQSTVISESINPDSSPLPLTGNSEDQDAGPDIFERANSSDSGAGDDGDEDSMLSRNIQNQPEELPIELASLTDRYCGHSLFILMWYHVC